MADLIRMGGVVGIPKDRLGSPPSSGSEDGGVGVDLSDLAQELDQDEFDGSALCKGNFVFYGRNYRIVCSFFLFTYLR